jgi:hypothetical protein
MRNTLRRGQGTVLILGARIVSVPFVFLLHACLYHVGGALAGEDHLIRVLQGVHTFSAPVYGRGQCGFRGNMLGNLVIPT